MIAAEGFRFEADFVEDGMRCIPMAARLRLDLCGVKLSLLQWSKMTQAERQRIACWPYERKRDMDACRDYLETIVFERTGKAAIRLLTVDSYSWEDVSRVPEAVEMKMAEFNWTLPLNEWRAMSELQRFALVKLTRPGHENRNFPLAVMEFRERAPVPVH